MKLFDFETIFDTGAYGVITVHAAGSISTYYPSSMYNSRGDPGDDAEGGDVEYNTLEAFDKDDNEIDFPENLFSELDYRAFNKAD